MEVTRMVTIPCLVCDNESIELPECFDTKRYDGHLVCQDCSTLYHIKLADGKVQMFKIIEKKLRIPSADVSPGFCEV